MNFNFVVLFFGLVFIQIGFSEICSFEDCGGKTCQDGKRSGNYFKPLNVITVAVIG
jgi:hypothetical protein